MTFVIETSAAASLLRYEEDKNDFHPNAPRPQVRGFGRLHVTSGSRSGAQHFTAHAATTPATTLAYGCAATLQLNLRSLAMLQVGLEEDDTPRPSIAAVDRGLALLDALFSFKIWPDNVYASPEGRVVIAFEREGFQTAIEVYNDEETYVVLIHPAKPCEAWRWNDAARDGRSILRLSRYLTSGA